MRMKMENKMIDENGRRKEEKASWKGYGQTKSLFYGKDPVTMAPAM
jgi:hypothetical protein